MLLCRKLIYNRFVFVGSGFVPEKRHAYKNWEIPSFYGNPLRLLSGVPERNVPDLQESSPHFGSLSHSEGVDLQFFRNDLFRVKHALPQYFLKIII